MTEINNGQTIVKEVEVFRLTPEVGKFYKTTTCNRTTGVYPNRKYYSKNELIYVGKFVKILHYGGYCGDGVQPIAYFDMNGNEVTVKYTYEGTTCFIEVNDPSLDENNNCVKNCFNFCFDEKKTKEIVNNETEKELNRMNTIWYYEK
jgi:hypothetical protein